METKTIKYQVRVKDGKLSHYKTNGNPWVSIDDNLEPIPFELNDALASHGAAGNYGLTALRPYRLNPEEKIGEIEITKPLSRMQVWRKKNKNGKRSVMTKLCRTM